jgi:hypothetical protein
VLGRDMTASNANLVAVVRLFILMVADFILFRILSRDTKCVKRRMNKSNSFEVTFGEMYIVRRGV